MFYSKAPAQTESLNKKTFYGWPLPSPCVLSQASAASRSTTSSGINQTFSFGVIKLDREDNSSSRLSEPLVVPLPQNIAFPTPKSGRLSKQGNGK
jgi:hypothetical protein